MNEEHKLIPLKETQAIPVHWTFTQDEYDKLVKGYRSNWCVFLRDDNVHFCRIGGEEFYRFSVVKISSGYETHVLESYANDDFYTSAKLHGWTDEKIAEHDVSFKKAAIEETSGLLDAYFGITVAQLDEN